MTTSFVEVIDSGPGWTKVRGDDGQVYTLNGNAAWRNNNPGNLRPGSLTNNLGAIGVSDTGSNGKFLVFPDPETGRQAQERLQFETPRYANKSIAEAIKSYAPSADNNDPDAYANRLAASIGVPVTTKLSDLTPGQRQVYLQAQRGVENSRPGTIKGEDGTPVDPSLVQRLQATPLPAASIPETAVGSELDVRMPNSSGSPDDRSLWAQSGQVQPAPSPGFRRVLPPVSEVNPLSAPAPLTAGIPSGVTTTAPLPITVRGGVPGAPIPSPSPGVQTGAVRLPSGKYVMPGIQPSTDGKHMVEVSDDGTGKAVVKKLNNLGEVPGVLDPLHEDHSIAGTIIKNALAAAKQQAAVVAPSIAAKATDLGNRAEEVGGNLGSQALQFAAPLGDTLGSFGASLGAMFGGGGNKTSGSTSSVAPTQAKNSSGSPDDRDLLDVVKARAEKVTANSQTSPVMAAPVAPFSQSSPTIPGSSAAPFSQTSPITLSKTSAPDLLKTGAGGVGGTVAAPDFTVQQRTVANPAYKQWLADTKADDIGAGDLNFDDIASGNLSTGLKPKVMTVAPPKTITITQKVPVRAPIVAPTVDQTRLEQLQAQQQAAQQAAQKQAEQVVPSKNGSFNVNDAQGGSPVSQMVKSGMISSGAVMPSSMNNRRWAGDGY